MDITQENIEDFDAKDREKDEDLNPILEDQKHPKSLQKFTTISINHNLDKFRHETQQKDTKIAEMSILMGVFPSSST
jgi:hypothetical protein